MEKMDFVKNGVYNLYTSHSEPELKKSHFSL